jgi:hypothetical protein
MENKSLTMALQVVENYDWKVFPVNTINKQPLIKGWQHKATNNLQSINDLFSKFDNCMIGLPTGPINGISVIDFDIKNNVNGLQNFFNKGFTVNNTSCVLTPSGGFHLYFRTNQLKLPNIVSSVLGKGVDFKGAGGYVVCPPSISKSGQYIWSKKRPKPKEGIKELPPYLIKILNSKKSNTFASSLNLYDPIYEGQRDNELTRRCGSLLKKVNFDEVLVLLNKINQQCCRPPLPERQVFKIFRSISRRESR